MDAEQLDQDLYDKMAAEQERFKHVLLGMSPEEVLTHAYEYAMREDILAEMEELDLPADQAAALLALPYANINTPYWQEHFYGFGRLPEP